MTAIRAKRMEPFKQRFRQGCQLLVIEDVQFLGSKTATQLELFHTLAHLLDAGVRVVLSADRLPRRSDGFEPRLCSQMAAGLVAELEPPDAAVRRRILRAKASAGGVRRPRRLSRPARRGGARQRARPRGRADPAGRDGVADEAADRPSS